MDGPALRAGLTWVSVPSRENASIVHLMSGPKGRHPFY
jgi:hypothetical protein